MIPFGVIEKEPTLGVIEVVVATLTRRLEDDPIAETDLVPAKDKQTFAQLHSPVT